MIRRQICTAILALMTVDAFAERRFVSINGQDGMFCEPCRTFAGAIDTMGSVGGEINCLDVGDFGPLDIPFSLTVDCTGGRAKITPLFSKPGITIDNPDAVVELKGIDVIGTMTNATYGIRFLSGVSLDVEDVVVHGTVDGGIDFRASGATLNLRDVKVLNSRGPVSIGVVVAPSGGTAKVSIQNSSFDRNPYGIAVQGSANVQLSVIDTNISNAAGNGILINPVGGVHKVEITGSSVANSTAASINVVAGANNVQLSIGNSTVSNSADHGINIAPTGGLTKLTLQDSRIVNNTGTGVMLSPTGSAKLNATVIGSALDANLIGIRSFPGGSAVSNVTVSDTSTSNNAGGIHASGKSVVSIIRAAVGGNSSYGVGAVSPAAVRIGSSVVSGNTLGFSGPISSYGNNQLHGNTNVGSTSPLPPGSVP